MFFVLVGSDHKMPTHEALLMDGSYRFPSHQTWFLVICLVVFRQVDRPSLFSFQLQTLIHSFIEWIACLVLSNTFLFNFQFQSGMIDLKLTDIGLPAYDSISVGPRIFGGLFQGLAARASGFAIFPLASFAPALQ